MAIILGIDPGSRITGYGIIWTKDSLYGCIAYGQINVKKTNHAERLLEIHQALMDIISRHKPEEVSIEEVFMHKNPQSALKLGQARGSALLTAAIAALPIAEYSARQIKQAIVGYGAASKDQMQKMIMALLRLKQKPPSDAADALAIAICHANSRRLKQKLKLASPSIQVRGRTTVSNLLDTSVKAESE